MALSSAWETFTVDVTYDELEDHTDNERGEITDRFESDLYRLIEKYQGKAGLKIEAKTDAGEPIQLLY